MKFIRSKDFESNKPWGSLPIAMFDQTSVKLHWTDSPYKWHINDGQEVFAVMDGVVDMHYKIGNEIKVKTLHVGDIFYASEGTEHVAHPQVASRVLVIEQQGSV
ncbi:MULTISPECIES: cupin [Tatumella]|uniref:Cupin n=1 Tax=Tatumella punctata TaxID=399969 RepID=A0ABW1VKU9_9GAMM|nr:MULTISPECIES: cupin [unclassified Tatumella]MBS0876190.1 cupin [Tatumella sp. JGM82]MBS0889239.1 cupin [Tatumella sp. JGM94]MBS0892773.1 cupin [Tatumella sp. JGM130]MBS0902347.1 cupin [Tatumella sp. JGM100]